MAKFNIQNFISDINKSGTLQTNRYEVFFSSPLVMQNVKIDGVATTETEKLLNLRAESVKIPGIGLLMSDVNRYGVGPMQKMPYNAGFTSNAITFLADGKNTIHKYFYTWMTSIFDSTGGSDLGSTTQSFSSGASYKTEYKDYYTTDIHVKMYDVFGNPIQEVIMYRAFPEALNDINLSWNDNNNLMKITVSFSFRDWVMNNIQASASGQSELPINDSQTSTVFTARPVGVAPGSIGQITTPSSSNKISQTNQTTPNRN